MTAQFSPILTAEQRERWGRVQDSFSRITGISLRTVDANGVLLSPVSCPSGSGAGVSGHDLSDPGCTADCGRRLNDSRRSGAVSFFTCHAGFECFSAPLHGGEHPVGSILGIRPPLEPALGSVGAASAAVDVSCGTDQSLRRAAEFVTETAGTIFSGWQTATSVSRRLSMLTNLFTVSREFSPTMALHEVHALLLNSLAILFDLESAALFTGDGNGGFSARYSFGGNHAALGQVRLGSIDALLEEMSRGNEGLLIDERHRLLPAGFPDSVRSVLLFPLFAADRLEGILAVFNQPLDGEARGMIGHFVGQAAVTMQNTILRRDLERNVRVLQVMTRFQKQLCGVHSMSELLHLIFRETTSLARAEQASLMLLNETTREFMVTLVKGQKEQVLRNCTVPLDGGLAGLAVQSGEAMLVKSLENDIRVHRANRPTYRTSSCVIIPLRACGRTIGVLNVADKITGEIYDEQDLDQLRSLATQATVALERSEFYELSKELRHISITDPLTALLNRRYFQERSTEEIDRARRYGHPFSLIMLDVDDFKFYNDHHGHQAGDELLRLLGPVLKSMVRTTDVMARYGGEEFAVLCPNTDRENALGLAERMREGVRDTAFPHEEGQPGGSLTVSVGVATYPDDADDLEALIGNADGALYRAKREGKNRTAAFTRGA